MIINCHIIYIIRGIYIFLYHYLTHHNFEFLCSTIFQETYPSLYLRHSLTLFASRSLMASLFRIDSYIVWPEGNLHSLIEMTIASLQSLLEIVVLAHEYIRA